MDGRGEWREETETYRGRMGLVATFSIWARGATDARALNASSKSRSKS